MHIYIYINDDSYIYVSGCRQLLTVKYKHNIFQFERPCIAYWLQLFVVKYIICSIHETVSH